jgi:hypothetical protein
LKTQKLITDKTLAKLINFKKRNPVPHTCNPSIWEAEVRKVMVQSGQIVLNTLSQKYPTQKQPSTVAQVLEQLPSKQEALSSNPSTIKKKKKKHKSSTSGIEKVITTVPKDIKRIIRNYDKFIKGVNSLKDINYQN